MLDRLVLARVAVSVHEEVSRVLAMLVCVDQTVGEVSASSRVGGCLALAGARSTVKVRFKDLIGLRSVAHMDHTQACSGRESVPVGCLGDPRHIVLNEGVVRRVSIHHTVHPNGRRVQH